MIKKIVVGVVVYCVTYTVGVMAMTKIGEIIVNHENKKAKKRSQTKEVVILDNCEYQVV